MKITYLKIENYRSLKKVELEDIPDTVILGGPNGVGKSSLFEAISFLKEAAQPYVGYSNDRESDSKFVTRLKKQIISADSKYVSIQMNLRLASDELEYVRKNKKKRKKTQASTWSKKLENKLKLQGNIDDSLSESDENSELVKNEFHVGIKMDRSGYFIQKVILKKFLFYSDYTTGTNLVKSASLNILMLTEFFRQILCIP